MTTGGRRRASTSTARGGSRGAARTTGTRRAARSRSGSGYRSTARRRQRGLPSTVGAALGTLVVTTLLDLSWPARLGLLALIVVGGLGYILWRNRREIFTAGAGDGSIVDPAADPAVDPTVPPAGPPGPPTTQPPAPTEGAS